MSDVSSMVGAVIGSYRVLKKVGEGGMGAVFLAEHTLLGRQAAIKVLLPALSARPGVVDRFFNEARAASQIADPGIVQIFDFGYHDGAAYLVMELLEGETLDERLERQGRLAIDEALRITRQVASSLAAAHAKGIVHRDLKPDNVFLVRDGEVATGERAKVLDFGVAKLAAEPPGKVGRVKTRTGAIVGTPVYMSPEQCRGAGEVDQRSDVYSLGCVLFHLLVGRPPFEADGMGDIIAMHLRELPPPPSSQAAGIPIEVDELVLRCLEKAPADRFPTMNELAAALGRVAAYVTSSGVLAALPRPLPTATTMPGSGVDLEFGLDTGVSYAVGTPAPEEAAAATESGARFRGPAPDAGTGTGTGRGTGRGRGTGPEAGPEPAAEVRSSPTPTTLGSLAGEVTPSRARRRLRRTLPAAAGVVVVGIVAIVAIVNRPPTRRSTAAPIVEPAIDAGAPPVEPPPVEPPPGHFINPAFHDAEPVDAGVAEPPALVPAPTPAPPRRPRPNKPSAKPVPTPPVPADRATPTPPPPSRWIDLDGDGIPDERIRSDASDAPRR